MSMKQMLMDGYFAYRITWRCDDEEEYCTESHTVMGRSIQDLSENIAQIEKDHTILSIERL